MKISDYDLLTGLTYNDKIPIESGGNTRSLKIETLIKSLAKINRIQKEWGTILYNNFVATITINHTISTETYGWVLVGTIEQANIRPKNGIYFFGWDNGITSHAMNFPLDCKIDTDGKIYAYLYSDHKRAILNASVTYVIGDW